jgi:sodium-dependent dicarboxylate transporter 2/3/5
MTSKEIKLIVWFVIAFGLMIASTWITSINSMLVAFAFTVIAFIPGINLVTKEQFHASIPWEIIMMIIGVQALATGLVGTGVATWFVNTLLAGAESWPPILIVLVMCVITMILHIAIPVGPPTVSVAVPLMIALVSAVNTANGAIVINPAVIACIGGILGGVTTWLPIDSIMMICYEKGWISMNEWVSRAWVSTVILLILTVFWTPFICGIIVPA